MNKFKLIYCPKCTRQLEVPPEYIGKKGECPYCGAKFIMRLKKEKISFLSENRFVRISSLIVAALFLWIIIGGVRAIYLSHSNKPIKEACNVQFEVISNYYEKVKSTGFIKLLEDNKCTWAQDIEHKKENRKAITSVLLLVEQYENTIDNILRDIKELNDDKYNSICNNYVWFKEQLNAMKNVCSTMECISIIDSGTIESDNVEEAALIFEKCSTPSDLKKFRKEKYEEYFDAVKKLCQKSAQNQD